MAKGKGKGKTGTILLVTTILGVGLLSFGLLQLNFDLSFIGFDITGNVTAMATVPEIDEGNIQLLAGKSFVGDGNVIETSDRFALGEAFQLTAPTVITDFTVRIATEDPNAEVTGYIWNSDQSPPLRIDSSAEIINGTEIGTVLGDQTFTFPQALVLEPTQNVTCATAPCDAVPVNYIVGIRVDKNLAGSFTYSFNETSSFTIPESSIGGVVTPEQIFPSTHSAVVDLAVALDGETQFTDISPRGLLGIDIFHNAGFGQDLMEDLEETLMDNSTATDEEQLTACIAIFPPPPECEGDNPLDTTECGVAEDLVNGICVCKEGFLSDINDITGDDVCYEALETTTAPTTIPPKLQVPPRVDPIVFLGLGGAILVISLIGIGIRTFRK